MQYFLLRGSERYGPYTVEDVRAYLASGNIAPEDRLEPDGGGASLRASELVASSAPANAPFAQAPRPEFPLSPDARTAAPLGYPQPSYVLPPNIPPNVPPPPGMDWWLVLLLSIFTCSLFGVIWIFVQANWVRKVNPGSRAFLYMVLTVLAIPLMIAAIFGAAILGEVAGSEALSGVFGILMIMMGLGVSILAVAACLSISSSLSDATASWGGARIDLGGAFLAVVIVSWFLNVLFFVAPVWIQYRLDEVRRLQLTGGMRF